MKQRSNGVKVGAKLQSFRSESGCEHFEATSLINFFRIYKTHYKFKIYIYIVPFVV